jgi:hypothetical protein
MFDFLPDSVRSLAEQHAGVISRAEVVASGLTDSIIQNAVRRGRWARVHPRVYSVASGPLSREGQLWAALLYAGTGATLSHETAAERWRLADHNGPVVHVTIPVDRRVQSLATVRIHYAHRLGTSRHPARIPPVTRVEDTVLDLIDDARDTHEVMMWLTRSCQRGMTTPQQLGLALEARKKISWRQPVEAILADVATGAHSNLELMYLRRVERAHGLPVGTRQRRRQIGARTQYSDVEYEGFSVIVELDGKLGHTAEGAFRDHRRDNAGVRMGKVTLRYGWTDTIERPCAVAAEVSRILQAHGWTGSLRPCGKLCRQAT